LASEFSNKGDNLGISGTNIKWLTKHYTENYRFFNIHPTKNWGLTLVAWMGKKFLLY
jgi:hypothetical protein